MGTGAIHNFVRVVQWSEPRGKGAPCISIIRNGQGCRKGGSHDICQKMSCFSVIFNKRTLQTRWSQTSANIKKVGLKIGKQRERE